jgi:hypothetical protein
LGQDWLWTGEKAKPVDMPNTWSPEGTMNSKRRREIDTMQAATDQKWRKLNNDKPFLLETEKLTKSLEDTLVQHPSYLKAFFRNFGYPLGRLKAVRHFLSKAPDEKTRRTFEAYVRYVARFGVLLKRRNTVPHFHPYPLVPWGSTFHVRIKKAQLLPVVPHPGGDEPYVYFFESDPKSAPPYLRKPIKSGEVKFVEIDDEDSSSVLTRLESFAYYSEGITFMVHNAEQPYLFCLIGEKVTNDIWRNANTAVTAFQRALVGKGKAGRKADVKRLKQILRMRKQQVSQKEIAAALSHGDYAKDFRSSQAYLNYIEKALR